MAIVKSVVQVNNGNTGWTKTHVLNALEQTFANLGFNDGSQVNGVACTTLAPTSTTPYGVSNANESWRFCGGYAAESYLTSVTKSYQVTTSGNSYLMREFFGPSYISTNDQLTINRHGLTTGAPIVASGVTSISTSTGSLTNSTTYYAIVIDVNNIKLATSSGDASSGIAIDITNNYNSPNIRFTKPDYVTHPNITLYQSDTLYFEYVNITGHPLYLTDTAGAYSTNRVLNTTNYNAVSYRNQPTGQGNTSGNLSWDTNGWKQGSYYYICQNHSSMTGTITVLPNTYTYAVTMGYNFPYWDYTVPSSGSRSSLTVRVYRFPRVYSYPGYVAAIQILSTTSSGWSNDEVFTIPGNQIGGATSTNDIVFGVNNSTTPSIKVTNLGAGANFYQKFTNQSKAILKVVNNVSKTYGTTYYGFVFDPNSDYLMKITSGTSWQHLNYDPNSSVAANSGTWGGITGLDFSTASARNFDYGNMAVTELIYCSSTTPTAYPLKIVTYKAQSPQDTNFALVQFIHTINAIDTPYATFFIHRGTNFGNDVWDLDNVFQGSYTLIAPDAGEGIRFSTRLPTSYSTSEGNSNVNYAIKREAFYGYARDGGDYNGGIISWSIKNNVYNENETDVFAYYGSERVSIALAYYRNSSYDNISFSNTSTTDNKNDFQTLYSVSSNANYYRPIKGLPLSTTLAPVPYYLPDDFTAIQFAVTPGATAFRPGDTITVSGSEIYEIVLASYTTNQTTFDGISQNTSKGIAFCARTT
jgi:plastocyanin